MNKKNTTSFRTAWILTFASLMIFSLNLMPVFAQVIEVEIAGGGYRLKGPEKIIFPSVTASFSEQLVTKNIRDLEPSTQGNPSNFIEITDENGGNEFQVNVNASDFTSVENNGSYNIKKENLAIKNNDGKNDPIATIEGQANNVEMNEQTKAYTPFQDTPLTLLNGKGGNPGQWRIFPAFQAKIPAATHPGTYQSVITFTIN